MENNKTKYYFINCKQWLLLSKKMILGYICDYYFYQKFCRLRNDYISFLYRFFFCVPKKKVFTWFFFFFGCFFCFFCTYTFKQIYEKMKMLTAYPLRFANIPGIPGLKWINWTGFFPFSFLLSSLSRNRLLRECGKNRLSSLELLYGPFNQLKEFSVWTRQIHIQDKD